VSRHARSNMSNVYSESVELCLECLFVRNSINVLKIMRLNIFDILLYCKMHFCLSFQHQLKRLTLMQFNSCLELDLVISILRGSRPISLRELAQPRSLIQPNLTREKGDSKNTGV
jgi:hypothetical protein